MLIPRLLSSLTLIIAIGACAQPAPVVTAHKPTFIDAVRPLQVKTDELSEHLLEKLKTQEWMINFQGFTNVCTVSHVNREKRLWVTAAHCVTGIGPEGRYIEGQSILIHTIDVAHDLALVSLSTEFDGPVLRVAAEPADWTTKLVVAGHPFGYDPIFITRGWVANPSAFLGDRNYMIFDVGGAPGNSGSPVMNENGELVSILQIGWGRVFSPVTGGATGADFYELSKLFN